MISIITPIIIKVQSRQFQHAYNTQEVVSKNLPMKQPMVVPIAPSNTNCPAYFQAFRPTILPLLKPRLKSWTAEIHSTQGQGCQFEPFIAQVRMQGERVMVPVSRKMMEVATPHLMGAFRSSFLTKPSSSISMILAKACFEVEINQTNFSASSFVQSLAMQMLTISCFYQFSIFSISYISLSSSLLTNYISLLDDTQSQSPISKAPTTVAETHRANSLSTGVFADTPVSKIMVVFMTPSIPPQTIDFRNVPMIKCVQK